MKNLINYINEANMNTVLWIDDIRNPNDAKWNRWIKDRFNISNSTQIVWVKSYNECIDWVNNNGLPSIVCFDHDLGDVSNPDKEKTGYDCCKYMIDYCMDNNCDFPKYAIQSDNGPGADNIDKYIKNFKKYCN